jgi:hypothetical protein
LLMYIRNRVLLCQIVSCRFRWRISCSSWLFPSSRCVFFVLADCFFFLTLFSDGAELIK